MISSLPRHSGIYFVKDNINNLQIKIHFRPINNLLKLPKYNVSDTGKNESVPNYDEAKEISGQDDFEGNIAIIKWQQKLFSATEYELYGDLKNCITDQQKKYHEILKMGRESINVKYRKQGRKVKRQRKQSKAEDEESSRAKEKLIFTYVQEDNFKSSSEFDSRMCTNNNEEPFEQMFVYAALKPDIQLVVMKWYKRDRLLYVYPDFTGSQNLPYFIEVDSDYRHLYSYGIEDVSLKMLSSANEQENFLYLPELPTHWRLEDDLSKKFEMPPKRTQRCAILFTINEISGFEYDNIHIRYHVKLPDNTILEEGLLDATTHSVSTSYTTSIHIGLTWQITVLCEEQFDPFQYLFIFFEVISIDSWERERLEGFCHYSLNLLQPCHHTVKLHCIRPVESFLETIHRFFVGGRRKFDYERFVCDRSNHKVSENKSNFHCRYGGRMKNSGQLNLTCQMLTQRNCELLNPCSSRTSGMTLDDIMMAYKEARRRLEAITLK